MSYICNVCGKSINSDIVISYYGEDSDFGNIISRLCEDCYDNLGISDIIQDNKKYNDNTKNKLEEKIDE
jgi:hypothetical protein